MRYRGVSCKLQAIIIKPARASDTRTQSAYHFSRSEKYHSPKVNITFQRSGKISLRKHDPDHVSAQPQPPQVLQLPVQSPLSLTGSQVAGSAPLTHWDRMPMR